MDARSDGADQHHHVPVTIMLNRPLVFSVTLLSCAVALEEPRSDTGSASSPDSAMNALIDGSCQYQPCASPADCKRYSSCLGYDDFIPDSGGLAERCRLASSDPRAGRHDFEEAGCIAGKCQHYKCEAFTPIKDAGNNVRSDSGAPFLDAGDDGRDAGDASRD